MEETKIYDSKDDSILLNAGNGLVYLQEKLNKKRINAGETIIEFLNYNNGNVREYYQLFCLSICMLENNKQKLNDIDEGSEKKLLDHIFETYEKNMKLF